jgi:hypothetical protein
MSVTVAWLCTLAGCLALAAPSASAAVTHKYLSQITEVPASSGVAMPGALSGVNHMAIDSGNLYVSEQISGAGSERLDEFNASSGAFVRQFALPSSLQAFYYFGLAAGHATGEEQVYAGAEDSEFKDFVAVFDGEGHLIGEPWSGSDTPSGASIPMAIAGIAADSSASLGDWAAGDVYVSDSNSKVVDVFKPLPGGKEEYVTRIEGPEAGVSFGRPSRVAVDQANGDVVVVDESDVVDIFEPTVLGKYALVRKLTGTPAGPFQSIETSGGGLAVDSNGDIYVAENISTSERAVYQFSATGEYLGRLTGTPVRPFHSVSGLAVDPQTHELYVGDNANGETEEPGAVDVFGPNLVIPDVTTGSASSVEPTSATISGTVDPDNAGEATCQLAWGTTTEFGNTTPCPAPIANGESPVPVQVPLTELSPDTTYHYRLQAANANGSNAGEPYQDHEFHTPGPGIHEEWSTDVASSSATFSAKIDPNGSATTYYFQYGTSNSYGTDVPVAPGASIGAGSGDVSISQHVQGLSASTTYHYRVVAVNELAASEVSEFRGPDQAFTTQPAASGFSLPDGRAWEMVSPPSKDGAALEASVTENGSVTQASVNGDAVSYIANGPTEDQPPANRAVELAQLYSARSASSWVTKVITTPFSEAGHYHLGSGSEYRMFSPDLSTALLWPFAKMGVPGEESELTPYLRRDATCDASLTTCYVPLLTTADVAPGVKWADSIYKEVEPVTATPDLSHVVLHTSFVQLLAGAGGSEETSGTYEWSEGKLQLVTILPDGKPAAKGGRAGYQAQILRHAISNDGSRVVFEAEDASGRHLYSRDTVTHETVQVDAVQPGASGGYRTPEFQLASADGSKVFFLDSARLTADSTAGANDPPEPDLYEFDVETGRLTDLTVDANHGEHANVQGLVQGASEDGSYVYFVANGVLAPGAKPGSHCEDVSPPSSASCNLYVRHAGVTTYIAALSGGDQQWDNQAGGAAGSLTARVSPNGRWFAFMSDRSLTGYDNRDANSGEPDEEVFLYDASANRLRCVSCDPTGARPVGVLGPQGGSNHPGPLVDRSNIWGQRWYAALIPGVEKVSLFASVYQSRYLSDNGRLFFDSNEALVPQDVNGTMDVYEYEPEGEGDCTRASSTFQEASGGCVDLISSGSSAEESAFMDASESGNDVFFLTAARLRPEDYDNAPDLYDARVCTDSSPCLPVPAAAPPPCVTGDGCRPAPSPQPSVFGAAPSATFSGAGNVTAAPTSSFRPKVLKRAQTLTAALRACHKRHNKRKQAACVRRARKRYASKPMGKRSVAPHARSSSTTSGR